MAMTDRTQQTATIYQFPVRPRETAARLKGKASHPPEAMALPKVEFGAGWYHDAAIRDTDDGRKH